MKAMHHRPGSRIRSLVMLALFGGIFPAGCSQNLFTDATDAPRDSKIDKYWDGDSAIRTTESRRKSSEMGFGYPTGSASQ